MYNYKILNFRFKTHFYRFHLISKQKSLSKRNFIPKTALSNKNRYFTFSERPNKEKKRAPSKKKGVIKEKNAKFTPPTTILPKTSLKKQKKRSSIGNFTER